MQQIARVLVMNPGVDRLYAYTQLFVRSRGSWAATLPTSFLNENV